jgi:hypothetical protein
VRWCRPLVVAIVLACAAALPSSAAAAPKVVWLCKPGLKANPCDVGLSTTRFSPSLERLGVDRVKRPRRPKFDCFYVYPTVSDQPAPAANFAVDPELRSVARFQASRYTSECRMYAPVYRQITLAGLDGGVPVTAEMRERAYRDVRNAWRRYLAKFNDGRGVVLIGHSQGTFVLRELVEREIDPKPKVRKRLISALLLGGLVLVKEGRDTGGDFKHVKACRSRTQVGCIVAFSAYSAPPPANAIFGRTSRPGLEVLCTNPAALRGGSGTLDPVYPTTPFASGTTIGAAIGAVGGPQLQAPTAWVSFPGSYRGRCSSGEVNVLAITPLGGAPVLNPVPDASWGLHLTDANLALGNLVELVRAQAGAWLEASR